MMVHFIGAGPGAADLLTLRGRDKIHSSPVCLYAGSLVPKEILAHAPQGARIVDTSEMNLDEIIAEIADAHAKGLDVARIHSGDLSIWSTMAEQIRRLRQLGIPYDVTPGVPAFAAARRRAQPGAHAPARGADPDPYPHLHPLHAHANRRGTRHARTVGSDHGHPSVHPESRHGDDPVAPPIRSLLPWSSWSSAPVGPDQQILRGTLATIKEIVTAAGIDRNALILVGKSLAQPEFGESFLYSVARDRTPEGVL